MIVWIPKKNQGIKSIIIQNEKKNFKITINIIIKGKGKKNIYTSLYINIHNQEKPRKTKEINKNKEKHLTLFTYPILITTYNLPITTYK